MAGCRDFRGPGQSGKLGLIDLVVRDGWIAALGETWWAADQALTRAAPRFTGSDRGDIASELAARLDGGETHKPVQARRL